MGKFDKVQLKQRLWSSRQGWGEVVHIDKRVTYAISVKFDNDVETYTLDGKYRCDDKYPSLFFNEIPLPEEDALPFDLTQYLKENLIPKEFTNARENWYIEYDTEEKEFYFDTSSFYYSIGALYFDVDESKGYEVTTTLNHQKITPQQLIQSFKELGWL